MEIKPLLLVTWNDAQDMGEAWADAKSAEEFGEQDCLICSVGFQISKGPKYLTIGADFHADEGDYGRITKIPVAWVVSIQELPVSPTDNSTPTT